MVTFDYMILMCAHIWFLATVILYCLSKIDIKIASFNLQGFKNNSIMLQQLCNDLDIIFI